MPVLTRNARPDRRRAELPDPPRPRPKTTCRLDAAAQDLAAEHVGYATALAHRFGRRKARDLDRDDLVAEALHAVAYAAGMYRPAAGVPFRLFAAMIVRQRLNRWLYSELGRRQKRGPADDDDGPARTHEPTPGPVARAEVREAFEQVRETLPDRFFAVLWGLYAEELTYPAMARRIGVSEPAVTSIRNRAVALARTRLAGLTLQA